MAKKTAEERFIELTEYFNLLHLKNWTITGNPNHGGQANVIGVKRSDGALGVFRYLIPKNEKERLRFQRDVKVITSYPHPNIVKLLEVSQDPEKCWYISKLGQSFETKWSNFKAGHNPDQAFEEAIKVVTALAKGLIKIHEDQVVHRDIKPKNIIWDDGPVLIDFGIAYVAGEKRLTSEDDVMANLLSPDPALHFMRNVPPWLDVFLLSQLLIWMVSKRSKKNIQRPLDWRWVKYPEGLSKENILKTRAITAICSNYLTSPQNARQLVLLIEDLTTRKHMTEKKDDEKIDQIKAIIDQGKAGAIVKYSDAQSMTEARLPLFRAAAKSFEDAMTNMLNRLKSRGLPFEINANPHALENLINGIADKGFKENAQEFPLQFIGGEGEIRFGNGVSYIYHGPEHVRQLREQYEGLNHKSHHGNIANQPSIHLSIVVDQQGKSQKLREKAKSYVFVPKVAGGWISLDPTHFERLSVSTLEEIVQEVESRLTDPEVWTALFP